MGNIIVAVFAVGLITVAMVTLTSASLSSANQVSLAWDQMARRNGERERTHLTLVSVDPIPTSTDIDLTIRNSGQTALRRFSDWDVIIRYYATSTNQGMSLKWMAYTTTAPSAGQWTVTGLYLDAGALKSEVYDPNVLNPGEEAVIRLNITPAIPTSTDNLISIGAANGVTLAAPFSR